MSSIRLHALDFIIHFLEEHEKRLDTNAQSIETLIQTLEDLTFRLEEVALFWENSDTKGEPHHQKVWVVEDPAHSPVKSEVS